MVFGNAQSFEKCAAFRTNRAVSERSISDRSTLRDDVITSVSVLFFPGRSYTNVCYTGGVMANASASSDENTTDESRE